jgi:4-alpha-glucanotransferase
VVVVEDLGTVEPGVREALSDHGMLSYRLLWFERDDPAQWPDLALGAITTHDLPTVVGLWDGSDLKAQADLGLSPNEAATHEIRDRLARDGDIAHDAAAHEAVTAAHRLLARSPCLLLSVTLDDALGEAERPNVPGADADRPNWSLALPLPLEGLQEHPLAHRIAATFRAATDPTGESG